MFSANGEAARTSPPDTGNNGALCGTCLLFFACALMHTRIRLWGRELERVRQLKSSTPSVLGLV